MPIIALTREVSAAIGRCELTHLERTAIDPALAAAQHAAYERSLVAAGCTLQRLDASSDMPDSVFIEDAAVVFDEVAIIARSGAPSRRVETSAVQQALAKHRPIRCLEPPGTLDGGDVLRVGRTVFVGCSTRTNAPATEQLRSIVEPLGYEVHLVHVRGCLHLKSAVTAVADEVLLINREWIRESDLAGFELVEAHPAEPFGANALRMTDRVIFADAFPRTRERLERRGIRVDTVDVSELAKAEGGVTCCSIIFKA
jgi:dimethylargininase